MFWKILGDVLLVALLNSAKPKRVYRNSCSNEDIWNDPALGFRNCSCIYNLNLQFGSEERKEQMHADYKINLAATCETSHTYQQV